MTCKIEKIMNKYKKCEVYYNAVMVPSKSDSYDQNAVAYINKKYIPSSVQTISDPQMFTTYQRPRRKLNIEAIYGGPSMGHIGHFILESLPRLWFARENPSIPIIFNSTNIMSQDWQHEIFDILSIKNKLIFCKKPTVVKKLHILFALFSMFSYSTCDYYDFLGVYKTKQIIPGKKIFLSRAHIEGRGYINQLEIEKYAKKNNYKVLIPDNMSMYERLEELASAEEILMIEGSSFYSFLLIKDFSAKTRIIPRFIDSQFIQYLQYKENIKYLDVKRRLAIKDRTISGDSYFIDIADLDNALTNDLCLDTKNLIYPTVDVAIEKLKAFKTPFAKVNYSFRSGLARIFLKTLK